jgi:hypothetical protein
LTPMYASGYTHFYINEICQLDCGQYIIPHDWVVRKKELTARCSLVSYDVVCQACSFITI